MIFKTVSLYLLYIRRLISYYIEGKTGQLSDIVHLEEGFYHDLKGLYSKRLGLPINKYNSGDHGPAISDDIRSGAAEVIKRFSEAIPELVNVLPPDWALMRGFRQLERLRIALSKGNLDDVITLLGAIKKASDSFYQVRVINTRFEVGELLTNIVKGLKTPCQVIVKVSNFHYSLKLPYSDYNSWRRIFHNFIINSIEACESKEKDGLIEINLTYPHAGYAQIEIADNGVGMDDETLANFSKRGYTKGKVSGQGLGINEDTISFLNSNGKFVVESKAGHGTAITIEIDSARIAGAKARAYIISPAFGRKLRVTAAFLMMTIAAYFLLSIPFAELRLSKQPGAPSIYSYEVTNRNERTKDFYYGIKAIDRSGKVLWEKNIAPLYIVKNTPFAENAPIVEDMNSDGSNEIIFSTSVERQVDSVNSGEVLCISSTGTELWRHELGHPLYKGVFGFEDGAEGPYTTKFLCSFHKRGDKGCFILVGARANYFPTQLCLFDGNGTKLGEYWHSGEVSTKGGPFDFDQDGEDEFLFYGVNNRLGWAPVVFLRGVEGFSGISPPYNDSSNHEIGKEKYYVFGRFWPNEKVIENGHLLYNPGTTGHYVSILNADFVRYLFGPERTPCIRFSTEDGRSIYFDNTMVLKGIVPDDSIFTVWYENAELREWAGRQLNKADLNQLNRYRLYENGKIAIDNLIFPEKYDYSNYWAQKLH